MLKLVLFDFDGTLVNSMEYYGDLAAALLAKHYSLTQEQAKFYYFQTSGIPFIRQLEQLFPNNPENEHVDQLFELGKVEIKKRIDWHPHVIQLLDHLKQEGYQIGISSSEHEEAIKQFMQRKNRDWDVLLGARNASFTKGESHFLYLREQFNLQAENLLFIGDSLQDYKICAQHQVPFTAYLSTFSAADFHQMHNQIPCYADFDDLRQELIQGNLFQRAKSVYE